MSREETRVLRTQLPLPRPYVAPRTPTEQRLAEIWLAVLNMDRIGVEDTYHDLGGDSLLAAMIFNLIEKAFHTTVPMSILAKAPTIADLALNIDRIIAP